MPKSSSQILELSLKAPLGLPGMGDLMKQVFLGAGIHPEDIIESQTESCLYTVTYLRSLKRAKLLRKKLQQFHLKKLLIRLKRLQRKDWQAKWQSDLYPFALTRRIDVVPAWRRKEYKPARRIPVLIDTITAFGTGQHETTRFMARLIERCRGRFKSFFDIGTGTGILALVALHCGAEKASAIDINPDSVRVARKNLSVNGYRFDGLKAIDLKKMPDSRQYDFVAANLITDKLIEMRRKIFSYVKPGKYLAVSGIALENLERLLAAFKQLPLRCLKIEKGKDWAAVLYKRIK